MTRYKLLIPLLLALSLLFNTYSVIYNEAGDFSVKVDSLKGEVFNDNINKEVTFYIKNEKDSDQSFKIDLPKVNGWDISSNSEIFTLDGSETREVNLDLTANSNFDYDPIATGDDIILIGKKDEYTGSFEFPIIIYGEGEEFSINYVLKVNIPERPDELFTPKISSGAVSPVSPLRYSILAENLYSEFEVDVSTLR